MTETERPLSVHPVDQHDEKSSYNKALPSEVPVTGPKTDRKCTDVYCLVLFAFFNACLWTLSGWSYSEGNPQRLIHGWDVNGDFCGTGELRDLSYTYFPVPMDSIDISLCLPGCPVVAADEAVCLYDKHQMEIAGYGCFPAYPSRPFYNDYCLPADRAQRAKVLAWLYSQDQVMTRIVGDLARAWDELAIGGLIAFGAMMVYFFVFKLRYLTIPFYLLSIVVLMFLFAVLVYLLHEENWRVNGQICEPFGPVRMDECEEGDTAHGYRDLAWTTASIGFAAALAIACMAPRLPRGDMILRNSSRAFGLNPLPFICPCMGLILGVSFYAYFITFLIFTVSTGDPTSKISDIYPGGSVRSWDFHAAERVLVFFDIGMILWWFSFIVHAVEFVTAGTTAWWFFEPKSKDMVAHIRRSVHALFRYHCGSVLLAAVIVPAGRFLRNLFGALKFGIRYCFHGCLGCSMIVFKPCLFTYEHWFKYMTSDGMAFQTVMGGQYIQSAKHAYHLVKRQNKNGKSQDLLNSGNMVIWLYQLTIMMSGVVFVAWWLQYDIETYKSLRSFSVTSITAMALYELFITWFMAQLYAGFVRGVMHASVVCYLVNLEANNGGLSHGTPFVQSMHGLISKDGHFETDAEVSKARDYTSKVAPESAPVASHLDKPVSNPKPSDLLSSERHQPEAAPFKETPKEERAPTPPAEERHEIHQGGEEETELVSGKEKVGPSAHS